MRSLKGFTLIEILVSMAIILLLSVGSLVGFSQFSKRQSLNITSDTLRNSLNEAKAKSQAQVVVTTQCKQSGRILVGYQIRFNTATDPDSYTLEEVCTSGAATLNPVVKTVSLSKDVEFNSPPATPLRFLIYPGTINSATAITINLRSGTRNHAIEVDPAGIIR